MLRLQTNQQINLPVLDSIAIRISALDGFGTAFIPHGAAFRWRSDPAVGVFGDGAFRAGPIPGTTWLVAETPAGVRDSVFIRTYRSAGAFHITLIFADDIPDGWRAALEVGAHRWEKRITGELPGVTLPSETGVCGAIPGEPPVPSQTGVERGVRVYVGQSGQFPPGTYVEAVGGPCLQRSVPAPTTLFGQVTINRAKPVSEIDDVRLAFVAVHELGHVLGLVGVIQGQVVPWFNPATGAYIGPQALEGWRRVFGVPANFLQVDGGSHWQTNLNWDVMGYGGGSGSVFPISLVSVGALMDLGYAARWSVNPFQ